jgi:YVTN family beta-propeller protein
VTVIDGVTLATTVVQAGGEPIEVAVNSLTNQIYVANYTGNTVTVIDGATNNTSTVNVDLNPAWVAVNQVTNQIYVANSGSNTVTVIDGATLNPTSVTVGNAPYELAVDPVTNKIYVANYADGTMTMIDGATDNTTTIAVGNTPGAIEANVVTNKVYVPNYGDNTVSVIAGANAAPLQFVAVTPCRLIDTRLTGGPIPGGTSESFPIPQEGGCNIPTTAAAYSLNVSVVPSGQLGYLTIWPTGEDQPLVATLNSIDGRIKADAAIVPAGYQGAITIYVTNTTNVVLDINGYFAPVSGSTLAFYPLTPCRIADTRKTNFPQGLGAPYLPGHQERDFPILNATSCNIPPSAKAYSLNFSVVPHGGLGYMTVWPTGQPRPLVSTLNDVPGTIIANAAIVPAGTSGDVSVYPSNDTDVIIDINGYFAPAGPGGLSLYPVAPCRVIDTRKLGPPFSGNLTPPVDVANSACQPPAAALAYVFNATVVPAGGLGYLTLWPDGEPKPLVSTLNALDGSITNNMAIVPSTNGKVDAFASGITQLILDISSYFAP